MQVLEAVQCKSKEEYPPETIDNLEDFALRLLGAKEDGAPDGPCLAKFMAQLTDGELSPQVKVALLQCFTVFIDRCKPTGREHTGVGQQAALKEAQVQMAAAGAPRMVAILVQVVRDAAGRGPRGVMTGCGREWGSPP